MTKWINQPGNPFPPTIIEAEAIIDVGLMFAHIFILIFLLLLMIYLHIKFKDYLPILVVYMFSLVIGMESFTHIHTPFSPMFEIFFLVFQTSIFIMNSIRLYEKNTKRDGTN